MLTGAGSEGLSELVEQHVRAQVRKKKEEVDAMVKRRMSALHTLS